MTRLARLLLFVLPLLAPFILNTSVLSQTSPGFVAGQTLTAAELNTAFQNKTDFPITVAGPTYTPITNFCTNTQISTDITSCATTAVTALCALGNTTDGAGVLFFPAVKSPYNILGTITIPCSFVSFMGEGKQATYLRCANTTLDCIVIGQASGSQTRDQGLYNLSVEGATKTGGANVHIFNAYRVLISNTSIEQACQGINIETNTNNITVKDTVIVPNQTCSQYGIYWHSSTNGTTRADVLTLDNVTIDGNNGGTWSGATGIEWDGFADTMVGSHIHVLHMAKGLCANCVATSPSASVSPQFVNFFDAEFEGFTARALDLSTGFFSEFKCTTCDISNLTGAVGTTDTQAINVGANVTGFQLANSRIGNNQQVAAVLAGKDAQFANVTVFSSGLQGSGLFPAIDVLATANGTQLSNIVCGESDGSNFASYCVQLENGTTNVQIANVNATNIVNGAINDLGTQIITTTGLQQPPGSTALAQHTWRDNAQAELRSVVFNTAIGNNVVASQELTTGTANSFDLKQLLDQNGSPLWKESLGAGVVNGFQWNGPKYNLQSQGGQSWLQLNAGHLFGAPSGLAPTVSTCGTSPVRSPTANDIHGTITIGATGTACTLTWATARANTPDCNVNDITAGAAAAITAESNTLLTWTATAAHVYTYQCFGG